MSIAEKSPIRTSDRSQLHRAQRQRRGLLEEAEVVGLQHLVEVEVLELGGNVVVEHLHHLVGRDAVGEHPGDEGAGAGADVDVEVVDGAVDREQVEGAQGADLVDAAGEAAAAEHQRGLRGPFAATRSTSRFGLDIDDFAHRDGLSQADRPGRVATLPHSRVGTGNETGAACACDRLLGACCLLAASAAGKPALRPDEGLADPRRRPGERPAGGRRGHRAGRLRAGGGDASARSPRT